MEKTYTVHEAAQLSGVTVRTLHHYDHIGLLCPKVDPGNGYRLYQADDLVRLQQILFFRELDFPLSEIKAILDHPGFDSREALLRQKELLAGKQKRLDRLIAHIDALLKGEDTMDFKSFDQSEIEAHKEQYKTEVQQRWGHTEAFKESEEKTAKYGKDEWNNVLGGMEDLMDAFAAIRTGDPAAEQAQALAARWQQYITDHFYTCTKEILRGLGQMYVCDERFKANIDRHGEGTADFMAKVLEIYCSK